MKNLIWLLDRESFKQLLIDKVVAGPCEKLLQHSCHKGSPEQQKKQIKVRSDHWLSTWVGATKRFMGTRLPITGDNADGGTTVTALFLRHSFRLATGERVRPGRVSTEQLRFALLLTQLSFIRALSHHASIPRPSRLWESSCQDTDTSHIQLFFGAKSPG